MLARYLAVFFSAIAVGQAHVLERDAGPSAPNSDWKAAEFAKTCWDWAILDNEINAQCNDTMQRPVWSRLHLGRCLLNEDGSLKASNRGSFQHSCSKCSLQGGSTFQCDCKPGPNGAEQQQTTVDLDQVLGNFGGRLCCGKSIHECGDGRLYNVTTRQAEHVGTTPPDISAANAGHM